MSTIAAQVLLVSIIVLCGGSDVEGIEEPTFRYVTAYNKEGRLLRAEDVEKTSVNVLKPIIFLINGPDKLDVKNDAWYRDLMEEYLKKQVHNVFVVDWKFDSKSHPLNRTQSAGSFVGDFIRVLFNKTGEPHLDIHLVGLSAGSGVAAVAGERVSELTGRKVNRITALDPTYYSINGENANIGNANFVDVVRSDWSEPARGGHARFYLGKNCKRDFGELAATELFAKSINSDEFKGVKCDSAEDFEAGKCEKNDGVVFGENVDRRARGDYFVKLDLVSSARKPYLDGYNETDVDTEITCQFWKNAYAISVAKNCNF